MRHGSVDPARSRRRDLALCSWHGIASRTSHRWSLAVPMLCLACLMGTDVMAEKLCPESRPPLEYRLGEASVRLTREPGHGFQVQRVNLSGTGDATLERDGRTLSFRYPDKAFLALLNELYKLNFFSLPTTGYLTRFSIFPKDNGLVGTQALRMVDATTTTLCFAVTDYEKCVSYRDECPLEEIAKRIFSEADQLVKQKPAE